MSHTSTLTDLTDPTPEPIPADWNDDGFGVLESFTPDNLMIDHENGDRGN